MPLEEKVGRVNGGWLADNTMSSEARENNYIGILAKYVAYLNEFYGWLAIQVLATPLGLKKQNPDVYP